MATVDPDRVPLQDFNGKGQVISWTPLNTTDDTGGAVDLIGYSDRSIQFTGTFGANGAIRIEGSNDGTNYKVLTDPQGNDISKTAAALEAITEITRFIRPFVSAGDANTSLTATLLVKLSR